MRKKKKVLVVDSDRGISEFMSDWFSGHLPGVGVEWTNTLQKALRMLNSTKYLAVLMDNRFLDDSEGNEFAQYLLGEQVGVIILYGETPPRGLDSVQLGSRNFRHEVVAKVSKYTD